MTGSSLKFGLECAYSKSPGASSKHSTHVSSGMSDGGGFRTMPGRLIVGRGEEVRAAPSGNIFILLGAAKAKVTLRACRQIRPRSDE